MKNVERILVNGQLHLTAPRACHTGYARAKPGKSDVDVTDVTWLQGDPRRNQLERGKYRFRTIVVKECFFDFQDILTCAKCDMRATQIQN